MQPVLNNDPLTTDVPPEHNQAGMRAGELLLVGACALLARLPWVLLTPMAEAPDEHCHIWVARFLFEHGRLPHVKDILDAGIIAVYGSLPQLGYFPQLITGHLFAFCGEFMSFRLGSMIAGVIAVCLALAIGRELFPRDRIYRLALPLLMAFHPQLVFANGYTNTDSTVSLIGAAIILLCVRVFKNGLSMPVSMGIGFLLGILALTKYSAYSLFFGVAFTFLASFWLEKDSVVKKIQYTLVALLTCVVTCGWWFLRQLHEYPADILGTKTMYQSWALRFNKPLEFKASVWTIVSLPAYWSMKFRSYWGLLGCLNRYLWEPFYYLYGCFMLVAVAGGVKALTKIPEFLKCVLVEQNSATATSDLNKARTTLMLCMFLLCVAINISSMIWAASVNLGLAQGRYLFGVEVPILLLMIYGFRSFGGKVGRILTFLFVMFNCSALLYMACNLLPMYSANH